MPVRAGLGSIDTPWAAEYGTDAGKTRAFEHICDRIRAQLNSGDLKTGDKLPAEREMAEQLKVGRNAVREALRSLEMVGVIRLEKGRSGGAYIRAGNATRVTIAMRDLLNFGSIALDEITESRAMLMGMVTRLACERASDQDIDSLERNVDATEEATKAQRWDRRAAHIADFYVILARSTGNRVLIMMVASLGDIVRRFMETQPMLGRPLETLITSRRRILRHLRSRDAAQATKEIDAHLATTHRAISDALAASAALEREAAAAVAPAKDFP